MSLAVSLFGYLEIMIRDDIWASTALWALQHVFRSILHDRPELLPTCLARNIVPLDCLRFHDPIPSKDVRLNHTSINT